MKHDTLPSSRNKLFFLLSLLLLVFSQFQTGPVRAASETIVKVEPTTSSANTGETFTANITIENVQNLYGLEITLQWNSTILEATGLDVRTGQPDGTLCSPFLTVENTLNQAQGKYSYVATSTTPAPPFNGSGIVVKITFNVTSLGGSNLNLESQLYDYPPPDRWPRVSLPIGHTTIDGSFVAIPEFPNMIILLLSMLVSVLSFMLLKLSGKLNPRSLNFDSSNKTY